MHYVSVILANNRCFTYYRFHQHFKNSAVKWRISSVKTCKRFKVIKACKERRWMCAWAWWGVLMTGKARWGRPAEALLLAVIAALPEGWNSKLVFHNEPDGVSVRLSDGPPIQYSVAPQVCCRTTDILTPSHLSVWLGFWRSGLQGQSPGVNLKYIKSRRKGINLQRRNSCLFFVFLQNAVFDLTDWVMIRYLTLFD